ncbi:MAG: hypothetical protein WAV89_13790 [Ignavibacteriaceae bacterium]
MIHKIISGFILLSSMIFSQQVNIHSPQNIKLFADYLFCEKDYLRAIDEYKNYLATSDNDTVSFKIALSFLQMGDYKNAIDKFSDVDTKSMFYNSSKIEKLKALFLIRDSLSFYSEAEMLINSGYEYANNVLKLKYSSFFFTSNLPAKNDILVPFNSNEKIKVSDLYDWKQNPPYKSELLAGILSTVIPGAGKIYTQNYGDGITAFILTGLFGYLAYTNFDHNHDFRAWTFTGLNAFFYAGNIYGSVASAQIFNAKINFEFNEGVKLFLEDNNYFTPGYDFCK